MVMIADDRCSRNIFAMTAKRINENKQKRKLGSQAGQIRNYLFGCLQRSLVFCGQNFNLSK